MFLIIDHRYGIDNHVFIARDPRKEGYEGDVTENANLIYKWDYIHSWPYGEPSPSPRLGRDPQNPNRV